MYISDFSLHQGESAVVLKWLTWVIGIISPLTAIPQIVNTWGGLTEGSSLITWSWMALASVICSSYALLKKDQLLVLLTGTNAVVRLLVTLGLLWHQGGIP